MLHVTIKDTKTDEVLYDKDVSVIALQAVDRENVTRLRHTSEDAEPMDVFLCTRALIKEASEAKKYFQTHSRRRLKKLTSITTRIKNSKHASACLGGFTATD